MCLCKQMGDGYSGLPRYQPSNPPPAADTWISQQLGGTEASNLCGHRPPAAVNRYSLYSRGFSALASLCTWKGFDQECLFKKKKKSHCAVPISSLLLFNLCVYLCCHFMWPPSNEKTGNSAWSFKSKRNCWCLQSCSKVVLTSIPNTSRVLAVVVPLTGSVGNAYRCIPIIRDSRCTDLRAFTGLLIVFPLAGTACAAVTALFRKRAFAGSAALSRILLSPGRFATPERAAAEQCKV